MKMYKKIDNKHFFGKLEKKCERALKNSRRVD